MNKGSPRHRPLFHAMVLAIGFVVGGFMNVFARRFLPVGAVKEFLTTGVTPALGPLKIDLVILSFSLGPIAMGRVPPELGRGLDRLPYCAVALLGDVMNFGNLGFTEILLILVVVLLLFGARRLPEIGASFGKGIREFKKSLSDVNSEITQPQRTERISQPAQETRVDDEVRPEPKRLLN
ncbi:MAG: twin-arginine translocase TatA/TatE family subunit [Gemmatimonadaceae bacterium]